MMTTAKSSFVHSMLVEIDTQKKNTILEGKKCVAFKCTAATMFAVMMAAYNGGKWVGGYLNVVTMIMSMWMHFK